MKDYTRQDRAALDRWLTTEPERFHLAEDQLGDVDPKCIACGKGYDDHVLVQRTDEDDNDYETYECLPAQPLTGSTFAKDNDPAFETFNVCRWFLLCPNEAVGTVYHSVLGNVPTCQRCADTLGLDLVK